ncbi:MAG: lipocalin-like domain-containing protein [Pseudonocardiaceae bacterium]
MLTDNLIGVWRLVSYFDITEAGDIAEGPLGTAPRGLLIYHPHGYMSVSMMPSEHEAVSTSPPGTAPVRTAPDMSYQGYSGKWRLVDDRLMVHEVEVSAHPHMVGTQQIREVVLEGDELRLYGNAVISEHPLRRMLHWQRA